MTRSGDGVYPDEHVARLAGLFADHPAWRAAAARIRVGSTSGVWFSQRPGEPWHLLRERGETCLLAGRAKDPDFAFRFTPESIRELSAAGRDVGDFAVRLFELMIDPDEERQIGLRIATSFPRLLMRGYVSLLLQSGPRVAAFAASHGVTGIGPLRRLIAALRRSDPFPWETG